MSETVVGEKGMVTAPHRAAAEAGAEVLRAGGNAVEAMIATAAAIAVVYPHMTGIGGDAFWLIAEPGRPPKAIDGAGRAGSNATIEAYRKKGYDTIPPRGGEAALTVAGAVSTWEMAQEIAAALGGRIPRHGPHRRRARPRQGGHPRHPLLRHAGRGEPRRRWRRRPASPTHYLVDGKVPEIGARLHGRHASATPSNTSPARASATSIAATSPPRSPPTSRSVGSPVTRADLARPAREPGRPRSRSRSTGATVFNLPPPTQGVASLIILGLFDRLKVRRAESFEHIHGLIEATKRAWVIRDRDVADPMLVRRPQAVSRGVVARRRGGPRSTCAAPRPTRPATPGATRSGWARSTRTAAPSR